MTALHIIEPTLDGMVGHCHSLVHALAVGASEAEVTVWAGRGAEAVWHGPGLLRPYFRRRWRRLQMLLLLRRLLREPEARVLIATAGSADFALAGWAARDLGPHRLYLFVHWLGRKKSKAGWLSKIARRQPHLNVLAPTSEVATFFRHCGFSTTAVPYPVASPEPEAAAQPFRHVVVAGAARPDKGFTVVVNLVAELHRRGSHWPITIQISREDDKDLTIAAQVQRLQAIGYGALTLLREPLLPEQYHALFRGGIALQPYRAADFQDRVSGVTLDALAAGCPVVVTGGTWMARLVTRYGAGLSVDLLSPATLCDALARVQEQYAGYAAQARAAGDTLRAEHSARTFIQAVLQKDRP